jgi:hypothetical protein
MDVPPGTGFRSGLGGDGDGITRYLMAGHDALQTANIIKLFEQIKGRPATDAERANVARILKAEPAESSKVKAPAPSSRKQLPPTRWGRPSSLPLGTGFGLSGITSGPKKPAGDKT